MQTTRLEAFSDGVIAIIITIMVLEMKAPHGTDLVHLRPLLPVFLSYVLSFVYVGIYWNNHHHLMHATREVSGTIMWANLHLLFWQSLVPFVTAWMGENHFEPVPTAMYGGVLLMSALSWTLLQATIVRHEGRDSPVARAVGNDAKGKLSLIVYVVGIVGAFISTWISAGCYVLVAVMWLAPDRRYERASVKHASEREQLGARRD
jgi:uncharacterized membrane protein